MRLAPAAAVYLPAAVTSASRKIGMSEFTFVSKCESIPELASYIASVCTKLANEAA